MNKKFFKNFPIIYMLVLAVVFTCINTRISYAVTPSNQNFEAGTPGLYNSPYTLGDWRFVLLHSDGNERNSTNQEIAIAAGLDSGSYALGVGADKAFDVIGELGRDIGIKINSLTGDFKLISFRAEAGGGGGPNKRVIGYKNNVAVAGATQDFTVNVGAATMVNLNENFQNIDEFRIVEQSWGTDFGIMLDDITVTDPVLPITGNHIATAKANTLTPVVGADNEITLTVKNTLGNTDTAFSGAKNVTISGIQVAPNGSYGEFNTVALDANSAGAGQVISVTFTNGVATANLKLNKTGSQTIGFSIAGVTTPATNTLTIVPSHGVKNNINISQNITAPAVNGGNFAQQPIVQIRDEYNNICTSDNSTTVTASKKDTGTWTLTGTGTITVNSGIGTFVGLGATNEVEVLLAQLAFNSTGLTEVLSSTVTLPAPAGNHTGTAGANTLTPVVGVDNEITLTVKNTLGNTDTAFSGAKNVTISGIQVAPNGSYGEFNTVALDANSAGAGQVISVTFTNGVATANLKLNKTGSQTIGFSIAGVTTPATNTLTIVPSHGVKNNINISQNITAPAVNGGNFAQQPIVQIRDEYNNICTSDNSTTVTASKKDTGTWTLTGTGTITVNSGIGTFVGLGATNEVEVLLAQLAFNSTGLTEVLSSTVTLPVSTSKAITIFNFVGLTPVVVGTINEPAKTVALTVPNGTDVTGLIPTITFNGKDVTPNSLVAHDFTTPQTYTVTAWDDSTQEYVVTVTIASATPPSSGGGGGGGSTPPPQPPINQEQPVNISVTGDNLGTGNSNQGEVSVGILADGEKKEETAKAEIKVENNQVKVTITVDRELALEKVREATKTVTILVVGNLDSFECKLNGETIKAIIDKAAAIEIKTVNGTYSIPANEIKIEQIASQLGTGVNIENVSISITVAKAKEEVAKIIENKGADGGFVVVVKPLEFSVRATYEGRSVEIERFNSYVERTVPIPDGVDVNKITTGIILEPDGSLRHVPTKIELIDGKYYAKINSLTNSNYSVIYNEKHFKDVKNHWSRDYVNDMASRMIISGIDSDNYDPNREITRAEFSTILIRSLGLKGGKGSNYFKDVKDADWFSTYVKAAYKEGIVTGYEDGNYKPNDKITREQAMVMISKTMNITGLDVQITDNDKKMFETKYSDINSSSIWARDSIERCLKAGIVSGKGIEMIVPKDNITRGEVAVIIKRLLQKSDLI